MQPLAGILVVDLTRYLPGAYAARELHRLGARVVRVEPPEGDPMRAGAPAWDAALRAGAESVV
ncbi:MAG: CoA transferase, partial [Gaiellaceae bacterium]|nr:CoA transferase [Gaiellaceae bacterium]